MAQTSINIQPVKGGSEEHNKRQKKLDYVRDELSHLNDYWEKDTQANRFQFIKENTKLKTGRSLQAKATPIREAVVVIQESTTMEDLIRLSEAYRQKFGIDTFQIAIHKDEGHHKAKEWKPNLHAHLVFDWTDHNTGKSIKLNRNDMAEMQTITAEILQMERGVSSEKKHLSAMQFKAEKEEERIKYQKNEIKIINFDLARKTKEKEDLEQDVTILTTKKEQAEQNYNKWLNEDKKKVREERKKIITEGLKGFLGLSSKDKENKELISDLKGKEQKIKDLEQNIKILTARIRQAEKMYWEGIEVGKSSNQSEILSYKKKIYDLEDKLTKKIEEVESYKKMSELLDDVCYSNWNGAIDAVKVIIYRLKYPHINDFFLHHVEAIQKALYSKNIEQRRILGKNLMKLANAHFPWFSEKERLFKDIEKEVDQIAKYEHQFQKRNNNRGYSRRY